MGVPLLYRWITNRYPEIKRKHWKNNAMKVDNLYLDFNAIIHPCCDKSMKTMYNLETQLYSNLNSYLDKILDTIVPRKLIFIAIDGVCPQAKLNQQRGRRFVSGNESLESGAVFFPDEMLEEPSAVYGFSTSPKNKQDGSDNANKPNNCNDKDDLNNIDDTNVNSDNDSNCNYGFNVSSITPGTKFMERLDAFLQKLVKMKLSTNPKWKDLNVIYSNYRVPGEGEHKIMNYIRKYQKPSASHVIFSPDADMIFLGLTLYDYNVYILREEPPRNSSFDNAHKTLINGKEDERLNNDSPFTVNNYNDKEFAVIDILRLKGLILGEFRAATTFDFDPRKAIEDWVLLCFLLGNDFLPTAPCFDISTNGIDKMTAIYLNLLNRVQCHITNHGKIDFSVLRDFFTQCASQENTFLVEKTHALFTSRARMKSAYDNNLDFPLNTVAGKIRFYKEKMEIFSSEDLLKACSEYITGILYVYNYYFYTLPSWDWAYKYHFSPFMCDLASIDNMSSHFEKGQPLRAMEQLLIVLPPISRGLLPKPLQGIYKKYPEMYPDKFKIDQFYKCMEWQAVPIIPFVDVQKIKQFYLEQENLLTLEEAERNVQSQTLFFTRNHKIVKKAEALYNGLKISEKLQCDEFVGRIYPAIKTDFPGCFIEQFGFSFVNKAIKFNIDL